MGERLAGKIAIVTGAGSRGPGVGEAMVAEAVGRSRGLDILPNNVGIESRQTLMDTTEQEWDRVMVVDLKSMLLTTQAAVPALLRRGQGGRPRLRRQRGDPAGAQGDPRQCHRPGDARWITGQTLVVDGGLTLTTR